MEWSSNWHHLIQLKLSVHLKITTHSCCFCWPIQIYKSGFWQSFSPYFQLLNRKYLTTKRYSMQIFRFNLVKGLKCLLQKQRPNFLGEAVIALFAEDFSDLLKGNLFLWSGRRRPLFRLHIDSRFTLQHGICHSVNAVRQGAKVGDHIEE